MNQFKFEQIARTMEKRYGKIYKGKEELHSFMLFPMESNLLKIYRIHPESNSRRLKEAIYLALHWIDGKVSGKMEYLGNFENEDNLRLRDALLMAFDPFMNDEVGKLLRTEGDMDLEDKDALSMYYEEPAKCILRILDSVNLWEKKGGSNGYFQFLEGWLGDKVNRDDKMHFGVKASDEWR